MTKNLPEKDKEYERLTPPEIIRSLGEFDLDPCAPVIRPWDMAKNHYTIIDDGLNKQWFGRIWCNPPYGKYAQIWLNVLHQHNNGVALVPARTASPWFHRQVFEKGDSILFLEDRIWFYDTKGIKARGNAGHDSVLIAYGKHNVEAIGDSGLKGRHLLLNYTPVIIIGVSPSWRSVVTIAINRNGGVADLEIVYNIIEKLAYDKTERNKNWKAKVRQKLQIHFTRISRGKYSTNTTQN